MNQKYKWCFLFLFLSFIYSFISFIFHLISCFLHVFLFISDTAVSVWALNQCKSRVWCSEPVHPGLSVSLWSEMSWTRLTHVSEACVYDLLCCTVGNLCFEMVFITGAWSLFLVSFMFPFLLHTFVNRSRAFSHLHKPAVTSCSFSMGRNLVFPFVFLCNL